MSIATIEGKRKRLGVSISSLRAAAGVAHTTWIALKRGQGADDPRRARTLRRLSDALDVLACGARPTRPLNLIAAFIRQTEAFIAAELVRDRKLRRALAARRGRKAGNVSAGRVHRLAIYIGAVELEVENAELARALGGTRQNVQQARRAVYDLVDGDPRVAAFVDRVAAMMRGDAAASSSEVRDAAAKGRM